MRKPNKQDFIFIGGAFLFIMVTFIAYLFITQYFITDNCHPNIGLSEGSGYVGSGYTCFGYFYFFDKISIYLYVLFLWITIGPFIKRKYLFPNNVLFILGIIVLAVYVLYTYRVTPLISPDDIPLRIGH